MSTARLVLVSVLLLSAACAPGAPSAVSLEELVGTWTRGDVGRWSERLVIGPDGSLALTQGNDSRLIGWEEPATVGGVVRRAGDRLELVLDATRRWTYYGGQITEVVIVRWGATTFLVPSSAMFEFCQSVNARGATETKAYPRWFRKDGDDARELAGLPDVPAPWRRYLLAEPLEARVVIDGFADMIDVGTDDGVFVGMHLWHERTGATIRAGAVRAGESLVRFEHDRGHEFRAGDRVTSRDPR